MSTAFVKLIDTEYISEFYSRSNTVETAIQMMENGCYRTVTFIECHDLIGQDAAEEVFDLTNNPYRQKEREEHYGRRRSLSVGDIVQVDEVQYLCMPSGWTII